MSLVTWVGTPVEIVAEMLGLAQVHSEDTVYDLGCGDGRILISAVRDFAAKKAVGYEIREDLCEVAERKIEELQLRDRITVIRADLLDADLSEASVITLYLSSDANELLRPKLENYANPSCRVVSHLFPLKGWRVVNELDLQRLSLEEAYVGMLYLYRIGKPTLHCKVGGVNQCDLRL